ncbi:protein kinase C delta type-like isoform X3 [Hyla sarda]|uniref:protein kinase C delta type-like n=1 Tax=Hyla sarda TaxID=327740 RepID=UPI0024C29856|nr:protein kinase C delta type-like [Hyla sarda]XP_056387826.1 protein kinase C delta type-like isoform X3 [Hyla sarda]
MTSRHLDNGCCCCLPTTVSWTERTDVYRIPKMAATGGRRDGEKERGEKREEESGGKRKREEESEEVKESGKKRKEEEVSEEVKKRKREEESEEVKSREKRKEEDVSEEVKKRKIEEESKEVEKTGEKRKEEEVSEEVKKRKREEESEDVEKRRGEDARLLEDEEPRPGTSQDPGTSSSYPKFNIYHLTVHQVLGRGSFGVVGLASVPGRNNYVAIKGITKTGDNAATLQRERRILMLARDCPFLCHLYAAQQSQDHAFFITEYLSGGSLEALLRMCSCLNTDNVRFYTAEIACGLQFLHGHNIVHRDIKPDNIMLDRDGHIRIIDLGVAQDGVTSSNKIKGVTGTLPYMAPEVLQRKMYYAAVDWWSLGIVVSRMSAGRSPFYFGCNREMAHDSITREKPNIPSWLPADLKHLIKKLLRKNPEKRLGVNRNIRDHPFFTTINWEELEQKRAQPPFTPFKPALKKGDLPWPEEETALHPLEGFSFIAPSWAC